MMKNAAKAKNMNTVADAIDRCLMILMGTVALSPLRTCSHSHTRNKTPNKTKRRIMRHEVQAYCVPPHCTARRRHITQGIKTSVPLRSNLCKKPAIEGFALSGRGVGGMETRKRVARSVTPPKGRLIQKHHPDKLATRFAMKRISVSYSK